MPFIYSSFKQPCHIENQQANTEAARRNAVLALVPNRAADVKLISVIIKLNH